MDTTKGLCSPTHTHQDDEVHRDYIVTDPAGEGHMVRMCADMAQEITARDGFTVEMLPLTPAQKRQQARESWDDDLDIVDGEVVQRSCNHDHITLVGNEETGLGSAFCDDCQKPLSRRPNLHTGEYDYFVQEVVQRG